MNTSPIIKLTAITLQYNGKKVSRFIYCTYVDGKAFLSEERLEELLRDAFGFVPRGVTFTVG